MSAFVLTDAAFQAIANTLMRPLPNHERTRQGGGSFADTLLNSWSPLDDTPEYIARTVMAWANANRLAVSARYSSPEESSEGLSLRPSWFGKTLTPVAMYKMLQCLRYQCSEDVPADKREAHERTLAEIDAAIHTMARAIVEATDAYNAAPWGGV